MAITSYGYDGSVSEARWAEIGYGMGYGSAPSVVVAGLVVSVGVGTRALAISSGSAVACNVLTKSTAAETVNAPANASGANRRSYVIAKYDWAANATTFEIKGSGAALPALTQDPGTTWEMPLAWFTIGNGAASITAGSINICKPTPRLANVWPRIPPSAGPIFATSAGYTLDTIQLGDPGWSYRVQVNASVRARKLTGEAGGAVELSANVDGAQFGQAISNPFTQGPIIEDLGVPVTLAVWSPIQTGPCRIDLITAPNNFPTPGSYEIFGSFNYFDVAQIPV